MDISNSSDKIYSYDFSNNRCFIDKLFEQWEKEIDNNLNYLEDDSISVLRSDRCMSKSLTNKKLFTRSVICTGCNTLNRLNYDFYVSSSKEIKLQSGKNTGDTIRIYSHKNTDTGIIKKDNKVFTRNPFANYIMVSSILYTVTKKKNYPFNVPYVWSYICNDNFNIVLNMKYMKTLREISLNPILSKNSPLAKKSIINTLNEKIVKDIFIQLTLLLFFLSKFEFSHGEPSINYITFSPHGCNFIFQKINVRSKISLLICPSTKSSITYNKKRIFYSKNSQINTQGVFENRDVGLNKSSYSGVYENHRIIYNHIGNKYKNLLNLYSNEGKYIKSFDFIMFLTSLIADTSYFESFKDEPKLMYIWKSLWHPSSYENLMKDIEKLKKNNFLSIFDVVKKYYFRDDALDFAMKTIYEL